MKRALSFLAALLLLLASGTVRAENVILIPEETMENRWYLDQNAILKVGNTTPMRGRFLTTMWGGTTSDLDAQDLLYAYSPVLWDGELGRFRFDHSVIQDALVLNDEEENHIYLLVLADDLFWSDGTPVRAQDYAFSILLQMCSAVAETGGKPGDFSWLAGYDEYMSGETNTLSGLRLITDNMLQITMKAESLPDFYELNRLSILPYPAAEIAPDAQVRDDGEGVYLTRPITADMLNEYVLDEKIGYLYHPRVVSGPYVLADFDGKTASFVINPYYKGNEAGMIPRIGRIEFTAADNADMIRQLSEGQFDLLNKVTLSDAIMQGIELIKTKTDSFAMDNEMRSGLTMIWFMEDSPKAQDEAVRKAIAYCFDYDSFIRKYTGSFGIRTNGFYGLGQWMYRTAAGLSAAPVVMPENASKEEKAAYEAAVKEWEAISLDSLTQYETDTAEAARLLEEAGWNLNDKGEPYDRERDQVRYRKTGEELTKLALTLMMPESPEERKALEACLTDKLREAGIALNVKTVSMETLQEAYEGRMNPGADMLYLGENFSVVFDPEILAPHTEGTALGAVKEELYQLALDMVRTEPEDLTGFEQKWVRLQERITATLPLVPVYTNVYFDFYTRKLHNYQITSALTWGEAVASAYMSDMEELDEEERERVQQQLAETEDRSGQEETSSLGE